MIKYSYILDDRLDTKLLENYPVPFLRGFHIAESCYGNETVLIFSDDMSICIPIIIINKYCFRSAKILHPPLTNGQPLTVEQEKNFIEELISYLKEKILCHFIVQPYLLNVFSTYPYGSDRCRFGSYIINLEGELEKIFFSFHSRYRNSIKVAEKKGAILKFGKDQLEPFYDLYKKTMKRQGLYYEPIVYFRKYIKYFEKNCLFGVSYFENIPQTSVFIIFSKHSGYYIYGGSVDKTAITGINKLLHWEVMKYLKKECVNSYILGGARLNNISEKIKGIQKFKEGFNPIIKEGYIWKLKLNTFYYHLYYTSLRINNAFHLRKISHLDIIDSSNE